MINNYKADDVMSALMDQTNETGIQFEQIKYIMNGIVTIGKIK